MRKIISFFALVILCSLGFAQQDPQVSLNMYNQLTINPAYAGCNEAICATILHREQWMGFPGRPRTSIINAHGSISSISSGIGLSLMTEEIAYFKNLTMNLNYAYRMTLGPGKFSLGLSIGFYQKSIAVTGDGWVTPDMLDTDNDITSPYSGDPLIPADESKIVFDAGFGAFYRTTQGLYFGLSSTHLPESKFTFSNGETQLKRHYFLTAGYYWDSPNPLLVFKPGLLIKTDGKSYQYDINVMGEYKKMAWAGVSYRVGDAIIAMGGVNLPFNLRIAVAYDFTTSLINSGSLEVMLNYCFKLKLDSQRGSYKSVRFL